MESKVVHQVQENALAVAQKERKLRAESRVVTDGTLHRRRGRKNRLFERGRTAEGELVELDVSGYDDPMFGGTPDAISLGMTVVADQKTRLPTGKKLASLRVLQVGVDGPATVNSKVG